MTIAIVPSQDNVAKSLFDFLTAVLPTTVEIVQGQDNRVPEPKVDNFVVFWPLRLPRLETNVDSYEDVLFAGSIAATVLTVTGVTRGVIVDGATLFGTAVAAGTAIVDQLTGTPGGIGTYSVSVSQALSSRPLSAGSQTMQQNAEAVYQCDFHGAASSDNALIVATMLRDEYAVLKFAETGFATPLYAGEPRQMPFLNGEQQYENRWVLEVSLQVNGSVKIPQQFADGATVELINVP